MSQTDQLIGVLGGLAVLLVCLGLALRVERALLEERLERFLSGVRPLVLDGAAIQRVRVGSRARLGEYLGLGLDANQLAQAGLTMSPRRFLLYQVLLALAGGVLAALLASRLGPLGFGLVPTIALGALSALLLVRLYLYLRRRRRLNQFETQLPIALDSVANAIQAGLSLPQALDLIGRDMPAPVGVEFGLVVRELTMGLPLEEALDNLSKRVPLSDVDMFVAAVQIQYRTGGSLSDLLHTLAHTIRERLRIRGEIRVLTSQQRLSAIIVGLLPFFICLAIRFINPRYFDQLLEPGTMRLMLFGAAAGMAAGFYALMRIASIEV